MTRTDEKSVAEDGRETEDADFIERLRSAIHAGGGITKVASTTGIPTRRLSYYLQGREIRRSALISIAKAAGVSVEWLTVGFDNPDGVGIATGPVMPFAPPPKLFASVNIDLLAAAIEGALKSARENNIDPSDWRTRAQLACLLYDAAKEKM